ncbi:MAG: c-type cytochrome [Fimbriiglobus sp.]|jgi:putative heme-binding domain-containing protein|nr:c-type cytochrome [Fimbriiglobus sp.]
MRTALTVLLLSALPLLAADSYTQKPEVAPAVTKDAIPAEKPKPPTADWPKRFAAAPVTSWIWGADIRKGYCLSKTFNATGVKEARLRVTCDNVFTLFVNGKQVAASSEWQQPVEVGVTLADGTNTLEAIVENEGNQGGFVLQLVTDKADVGVTTDASWTATAKRGDKEGTKARPVAKYGDGPWKTVFDSAGGGGQSKVPANTFVLLPGFQVEKLFTVPKNELGSWVCLTADDKGRLIASDQDGKGLVRITPPKVGTTEETKVEKIPAKISAAQGLLWHKGTLYVVCNGGPGSGLYRVTSSKKDDTLDTVEKLKSLNGGGEHGPHAVRLAPDGQSLYVICGNHTQPPQGFQHSRLPKNWGEDHLLPRQWDANGHARGILAPGGYVAKTDFDGKTWEIFTAGYRNPYDFAFNADGEMFVYDADMEWDLGMPWYRPTRVNHATSGSELGWRSGTGKWPSYYPDSLPAMVDIGPGSPVGVEFGYGAKFPAKYQTALYCCDWTFGTMYAIHTTPDGATYKGTKEEFLSRTPLPLTDVCINPADGAMYFTIGGRGTGSELYRVTYTGKESTAKVEAKAEPTKEMKLLKEIEQYHQPAKDVAKAVKFLLPLFSHGDRFVRYSARVALEHQPVKEWQELVLDEKALEQFLLDEETFQRPYKEHRLAMYSIVMALARQGDRALMPRLLDRLAKSHRLLLLNVLKEQEVIALLRTYQLVFIRMGWPGDKITAELAKTLHNAFRDQYSDAVKHELVQLLVYLKSPDVVKRVCEELKKPSKPLTTEGLDELILRNRGYGGPVAELIRNAADQQKLSYLFTLRNATVGWNLERWKVWYGFLKEAQTKAGGASYQKFLANIEADAYANVSDTDRLAIEAAKLRPAYKAKELPKPTGPGKEWTTADLTKLEDKLKSGRNFKNGEKAFAAGRCVVCHRFGGDGGATGPDLTQAAGRFALKDLAEAIVEPSKVISDQYKASVVETKSGNTVNGRIVAEVGGKLVIVTDPEDSSKVVEVAKADVESVKPSTTSLMPAKLIDPLGEAEVLDLLAFLLSRGDPTHPAFKK